MLIQKFRLQRGWSQQQLADLSGLSTRTIQRLENGQPASVESLKALAAVFEVDFHTLKGESPMSVPYPDSPAPASAAPVPAGPVPTAVASSEEEEAFAHVRKVQSFYRGVLIYLLAIAVLAVINIWSHPDTLWVRWVALGWGLGLCIKALKTFDVLPFGASWEKRAVEKRLGRKL